MNPDEHMEANADPRILHLEGAVNFRDLGGLPTADGRTIRRGLIFRSDVLYRLTPADEIALRPLGLRSVLDLRSQREVSTYPVNPLIATGIRHVNIPIGVEDARYTESMAEDNLILLRHVGEGFRAILAHLADDAFPVVINCFAGKDRTGLTCALILGALGVPHEVIVADYALSERHMARHLDLHRASAEVPPHTGLLPDWMLASPATMEITLRSIAAEWGSIRGYLEAIGVTADELGQISNALIDTDSG